MKTLKISIPELGLIASTRAILGVGAGLLLAPKLSETRRRNLGLTLLTLGSLSTIPLLIIVLGRKRRHEAELRRPHLRPRPRGEMVAH